MRVCPLLGWLDPERTRVGCLAHPLATGGPDLRDQGVYDASICETFLCPSHSWLAEEEAEIVDATCADAHLYGLVVTDVPFVRAVLDAVAALAGARLERRHLERPAGPRGAAPPLRAQGGARARLGGALRGLPARPDGEPVPRRIDYEAMERERSPWDAILLCVGADPRSGNDLDRLEEEVRRTARGCGAGAARASGARQASTLRRLREGPSATISARSTTFMVSSFPSSATPSFSMVRQNGQPTATTPPLSPSVARGLLDPVLVDAGAELLLQPHAPAAGAAAEALLAGCAPSRSRASPGTRPSAARGASVDAVPAGQVARVVEGDELPLVGLGGARGELPLGDQPRDELGVVHHLEVRRRTAGTRS